MCFQGLYSIELLPGYACQVHGVFVDRANEGLVCSENSLGVLRS